jgi:pyruvate,orthophosphate dikinase
VDSEAGAFTNGRETIRAGDWISLNGTTGEVIRGAEVLVEPSVGGEFAEFLAWADEYRRLGVRANADQPAEARQGREFGAAGIGLCRTEHMFFEGDRIHAVRAMILATTPAERAAALTELLPLQRSDFRGIFDAMDGHPVTIRLLDPPLHEFLPHDAEGIEEMAGRLGVTPAVVQAKVDALHEQNPMLGHRGCRLGITHPEITEMQARAIFEAAVEASEAGVDVKPEVMVPLVGAVTELRHQREIVDRVAEEVFAERGRRVSYLVGTMIEVPRAALTAGEVATAADFFSFGTNDLTQMTFGYSRDDVGAGFLPHYVEQKLLPDDPFQTIDVHGVGQLMRIAVEAGRAARPGLKIGVCGEHGGDPASVAFCHEIGLDYVSCSPFRVPVARLAAAQAALREPKARVEDEAPARAAADGDVAAPAFQAASSSGRADWGEWTDPAAPAG